MNPPSEHTCPICGRPNECAMAKTGNPDAPCWCREVTINPDALTRARKIAGNKSCICKQCASSGQKVQLRLYGTEHCHLCEEAEQVIRMAGLAAINVDIAEDEQLHEKYGMRIPVLQRTDNGAELGWPFDSTAVSQFLA